MRLATLALVLLATLLAACGGGGAAVAPAPARRALLLQHSCSDAPAPVAETATETADEGGTCSADGAR